MFYGSEGFALPRKLIACMLALSLPFVGALLLSVGADSGYASSNVRLSLDAAQRNFSIALGGGMEQPWGLFMPLLTSLKISVITALFVVALALPLSKRIGTSFRKHLAVLTAASVGARVLPVTTALQIFSKIEGVCGFSDGWILVAGVDAMVLFPLAVAMLAAAPWKELEVVDLILSLDLQTRWQERVRYSLRVVGLDLGVAASGIFLLSWSEFVFAHFFLDSGNRTISEVLANQQGYTGTNWGQLGATIMLSLIPPVVVLSGVSFLIRYQRRRTFEAQLS